MRNLNGNSLYTQLRKVVKNIMCKPLEVNTRNGYKFFSWFSSIEYKNKEGLIIARFSEELKPYIFNLKKNYTSYPLFNTINMVGKYSIRLYEMLKQHQLIKKREFDLEELYEILKVKQTLRNYGNFKQTILSTSIQEINSKTDLTIVFKEIKQIRKVVGILFDIKIKKIELFEIQSNTAILEKNKIAEIIRDLKFFKDEKRIAVVAEEVQKMFSNHELSGKMEKIKTRLEYAKNRKAKSLIAYLRKIIDIPDAELVFTEYKNEKSNKNKFCNYDGHNNWDYEEFERIEQIYLENSILKD